MKPDILITHAELKAKMLENPLVKAEYDRLNHDELAIFDEMLAARHENTDH